MFLCFRHAKLCGNLSLKFFASEFIGNGSLHTTDKMTPSLVSYFDIALQLQHLKDPCRNME